ncbi:MAG: metallophosphoesterase, partial [Desulfobacterales bacterium]|nr:metallophosphoesterase [Desulfobacterales bacterium]
MVLFFLIFFTISSLLATYISWRLFSKAAFRRRWKIAIALGVVVTLFMPVLAIMLRRSGFDNLGIHLLTWIGYLGVGFLSFIFSYLVIRDLVWLPLAGLKMIKARILKPAPTAAGSRQIENPSRRGFIVNSMNYGIVAAAAVSTGYGIAEAKQTPQVKSVPIKIDHLPPELEGFRIVQITDIHVSPTFRRASVEEIVAVVNTLDADIVVLTGDLVDGSVDQLGYDVAPLKQISSGSGNFFVTGNHEYYSGVIEWIEEVKRMGFTVLLNEHVVITRGLARLLLAGVTDYRGGNFLPSHRSDPQKALNGAPPADAKILLAHQPKNIFDAAQAGYDLQISGHTHGGQFFPWNLLVGFVQPYVSGLHIHQNTRIYVSRGTGY